MKTLALIAVALLGCKSKDKECPPVPAQPEVAPGVDPLLVAAICALTATPPGPGTGHTSAGVITNGKVRAPWFARDYDASFVNLEQLDHAFALIKPDNANLYGGLMPSSFCPRTQPVYISIYIYNATDGGKKGAWIIAGELGKPTKRFVEVMGVPSDLQDQAVAPVVELLGGKAELESLPMDRSSSTSGVDGRWEDSFRQR